MRLGFATLLLTLVALGCGDDDAAAAIGGGFEFPDAAPSEGCRPYYLSASEFADDAGSDMDAGGCTVQPGTEDTACTDILWTFAGGEQVNLPGCCKPNGRCGVIDPTGALGCMRRELFGAATERCGASDGTDSGATDAGDEDANVSTTL